MKRMAVVAVIISMGLCALTAASAADTREARQAITQAMPQWSVKSFDEKPSAELGPARGYRVMLCNEYKVVSPQSQAAQPSRSNVPAEMITKYTYIDLILFPASERIIQDAKDKLPWRDFEHEDFIKPVDMGEGFGWRWFANATPVQQHILRTALKLEGGDDPIQAQVDALAAGEPSSYIRGSAVPIVASFGDAALPYLEKAISEQSPDDIWYHVQAVGAVRTPKGLKQLQSLYWSKDEKISKAAAYALVSPPYREAGKELIDMLGKRLYTQQASEACGEFKVKNAMPALKEVCAKPDSWYEYQTAFRAIRQIQGKPVPKDIDDAVMVISRGILDGAGEVNLGKAIATLQNSPDKEAVAVAAMSLAVFHGKLDDREIKKTNEIGVELIKALPDRYSQPVIASIRNLPRYANDRLEPFLGAYQPKPEMPKAPARPGA